MANEGQGHSKASNWLVNNSSLSFYCGLDILLSTQGTTMSQGLVPKEFLE